jgi:3-deoxy-7-phosphoheptulonate synthase
MVEVHPEPDRALSDGPQSLHFEEFEELQRRIGLLEGFVRQRLG